MGRALLAVLLLAAFLPAAAHASSGVWDRAWGKGVNGGTGPGICTVAANCQLGQGSGLGAVFPQDVATDPVGNVYAVEYADRRVQKFDAQGHFLLAWGKNVDAVNPSTGFEVCTVSANCKSGEAGTLGGEFDLPSGIATDAAGHVYVADRSNNRIQEFTSGGAFVRAVGQDVSTSKTGTIETCDLASDCKAGTAVGGLGGVLFFPLDVAVGPDGRVYVANGLRRVEVFTSDLTFDRAWGADVVSGGGTGYEVCTVDTQCKTGIGGDGVDRGGEVALPVAVATSQTGKVYVFEGNRFRVERFTADGGFELAWGKDVDAADAGTGFEICTVAANCKTGVTGSESGAFRSPNDLVAPAVDGLAVGPAGTVYVADRENDRVQAFSAAGAFQRAWGFDVDVNNLTTGFEVCTTICTLGGVYPDGGSLYRPTGIAAGATGDVYTADQVGARIQKFTCGTSTVAFAAASATVAEAAGTLQLNVQRTGDTGCAASVTFATANGTALAGSDYDARSGTLTFPVGQTTATIDVPITPDTAHEGDETFSVTLSAPVSPATIGAPATSTVTIIDDDLIDTAITSGPAGGTKDTTPTFTFTADPPAGATFECAIDQGGFAACATPYTTAPLPDGPHRLRVRAVSPALDIDGSPAVRDFTVDTVAPGTVIRLVPGDATSRAISSTAFSGTVRATAEEQDPPPGVGNGVTRCVLDPPVPPATYDDLPVGPCPSPTTAALGTHTFYAASLDQVFNLGPVVSVTFKVLAAPDTQILGGPVGPTWRRDPEFTLTSTIPGSTFRCRIDGGSFSPCTTPYRTFPLNFGTHTLSVVAVSPEGAEDPTPATRTITVAAAETSDRDCRVQPFPAFQGQSRMGCGWGPRCPTRVPCDVALPSCPSGAVCTISLKGDFATPNDKFMQVNLYDEKHSRLGNWNVQGWIGFAKRDECDLSLLGRNTTSCSFSASTSFFGQDLPITTYCAAQARDSTYQLFTPFPGDFGPDAQRSLACGARIRITPASALEAVAAGPGFSLYAPAPGTFYVTGDIRPAGVHRATVARRVTAFRTTLRGRASKAGSLRFTPKLSRTAARILQRRHNLRVTLHVRFKPRSGKTVSKTRRVTLTQLANPRAEAIAKLRAYCRKHPELKRLPACKRALR